MKGSVSPSFSLESPKAITGGINARLLYYLLCALLIFDLGTAQTTKTRPYLEEAKKSTLRVPIPQGSRRVWVHYKQGKREALLGTQHSLKTKPNYDFQSRNSFVVTATNAEIKRLQEDANVERITNDPKRYLLVGHQDAAHRRKLLEWDGQAQSYGIDMVQADLAWAEGLTGKGVKVCVVDSGVDASHPDLNTADWTGDVLTPDPLVFGDDDFFWGDDQLWSDDLFYSSDEPSTSPATPLSSDEPSTSPSTPLLEKWGIDPHGHGTWVTGIIAASNNDLGLVGVAPEVSIHTIRGLDENGFFYASDLIEALSRCRDAGSNIISLSLGGFEFSEEEQAFFTELFDQGILSVASSGNDDGGSFGEFFSYPASYPNVLSVGAVDRRKNIATFSVHNSLVDLVAPGVDIWGLLPTNFDCTNCKNAIASSYASGDGTSASCPFVVGVAALLWSFNTSAPVGHIHNALLASAEDLGVEGRDDFYGQGLVQASAGFDVLKSTLLDGAPLRNWTTPKVRNDDDNVCPLTCEDDELLVSVSLKTDQYGNETFWHIVRNVDDFTVMAGAGLSNYNTFDSCRCLPLNCYTFTVYDSAGDGLCCDYGKGEITLTVNDVLLSTSGNFSTSESTTFGESCVALSTDPKPDLPPCLDVTLTLVTDEYPLETSVFLEDLSDNGAIYWLEEFFDIPFEEYTLTQCVDPAGCYRFEIYDGASDGICCGDGDGSFDLQFGGGSVFSGGAFSVYAEYFLGDACVL